MSIDFQRWNGSEWVTETITGSGGGGTSNHASLTNLEWVNTAHEGDASTLAAFDSDGNPIHALQVSSDGTRLGIGLSGEPDHALEVECASAEEGHRCAHLELECNGYNNSVAQVVHINSGDLGPGKSVAGSYILADVSEATSADSTTSVPCYIAGVANGTDVTSKAFLALAGFVTAFQVYGASADDPDYGYEVTGTTVADRVTGAAGDGQAFLESSASDLEIMESNGDYILIGSDNTFEIVDVLVDTGGSKDCDLTFYYSKAGGNWTALSVVDTSHGLQSNGEWNFIAPVDWTKDDEAEVNGDITNAYYIKIERTYAPTIPTLPTESYFKTYSSKAAGMSIRGDGTIAPASMSDASAPNDSLYYSTTASKLCYKDSGGVVNALY